MRRIRGHLRYPSSSDPLWPGHGNLPSVATPMFKSPKARDDLTQFENLALPYTCGRMAAGVFGMAAISGANIEYRTVLTHNQMPCSKRGVFEVADIASGFVSL